MDDLRFLFQTIVQKSPAVTLELTARNRTMPNTPSGETPKPASSSSAAASESSSDPVILDVYEQGADPAAGLAGYPEKISAKLLSMAAKSGTGISLAAMPGETPANTMGHNNNAIPLAEDSAGGPSTNSMPSQETGAAQIQGPAAGDAQNTLSQMMPGQNPSQAVPMAASFPSASSSPDTAALPVHPLTGQPIAVQQQAVSVKELAASLQSLFHPLLDAETVFLRSAVRGDDLPALTLDSLHTRQILSRLLAVVSSLSHRADTIELVTDQELSGNNSARLRVAIQASGCELPAEVYSYLSANQSLPQSPMLMNLALNLGLCKNLAMLMDGSLILHRQEGKGTLFLLELPSKPASSSGKHSLLELPSIGRFSGQRILLSEAKTDQLKADAGLLEKREILVKIARSSLSTVQQFRLSEPGYYSAVLTDTPIETAQRIRALHRADAPLIPIIGILETAPSNVAEILQAGTDFCLYRPFTPFELFQALDHFLL